MSERGRSGQVVDGDKLDLGVANCGAEDVASDAAEAVNAYLYCHFRLLLSDWNQSDVLFADVLRESTKRVDMSGDCHRFDGITGVGSGKTFQQTSVSAITWGRIGGTLWFQFGKERRGSLARIFALNC
jgi:hypothetical protein